MSDLFEADLAMLCPACARGLGFKESLTLGIIGPRTCAECSTPVEAVDVVVVRLSELRRLKTRKRAQEMRAAFDEKATAKRNELEALLKGRGYVRDVDGDEGERWVLIVRGAPGMVTGGVKLRMSALWYAEDPAKYLDAIDARLFQKMQERAEQDRAKPR